MLTENKYFQDQSTAKRKSRSSVFRRKGSLVLGIEVKENNLKEGKAWFVKRLSEKAFLL